MRNIIRQLNEDTPGKEKEREVVVRPDGTKVVRVTKKRKTLVSREEKNRHGRKSFMQALFVVLLLMAGFVGFFFYRMTSMSGEQYLMSRSQELAQLWGASSVKCSGAVIDGVKFHISNIVAEFPESSMVERVELSEVETELDLGSFFTGIITGDELKVARVHIHLRSSARQLHIPQAMGEKPWRFQRVNCPDFSLSFAGSEASPWSIRHTAAYMYRPSSGSTLTVVTLEGGIMQMRGWKEIALRSAKLHFSKLALEDMTLVGTTDVAAAATESSRSFISFSGHLAEGAELAGPYYFTADNMNFSEFTQGRFNHFFAARTVRPVLRPGAVPSTQVILPLDRAFPQFSGNFNLKDVSISGFPALRLMAEHIEPTKRKRYAPPGILFATASLSHDGGTMELNFDENGMVERDLITLRGCIRVDESSGLSGTLDYGIPAVLTHAEYRDGKADPLFREDGQLAWVATTLSGLAAHPQDDAHLLDAAAVAERAQRERVPFDDIDLERVNEFYRSRMQPGQTPSEVPAETSAELPATTSPQAPLQGDDERDNRLLPQDPFAPAGSALDAPF